MHQLKKIPAEEIRTRISAFQRRLQTLNLDGALITQNVDLFYLSGTMQNGILLVPAAGQAKLYIKKSVDRASFESILPVEPFGRSKELREKIRNDYGDLNRLGFELDVVPYNLIQRYLRLFPHAEPIDISFELRMQRAIKSEFEINFIRQAAQKVNQVIESIPNIIRPRMTEIELVAIIEQALRLQGNPNLYHVRGFNQEMSLGIVSSGAAAAIPSFFDGPAGGIGVSVSSPQSAGFKEIKEGEPILLDIGTICEGYFIDQTRIAVIDRLDQDLENAYQVAQRILRKVEQIALPGVPWEELYLVACKLVEEAGLSDYFMGYKENQAKFLGHGIGLEIDEFPILARGFQEPLVEGMVIAIEPKFIYPGRGVIGLENTYVVTKTGLESLSLSSEEMIKIKSNI